MGLSSGAIYLNKKILYMFYFVTYILAIYCHHSKMRFKRVKINVLKIGSYQLVEPRIGRVIDPSWLLNRSYNYTSGNWHKLIKTKKTWHTKFLRQVNASIFV